MIMDWVSVGSDCTRTRRRLHLNMLKFTARKLSSSAVRGQFAKMQLLGTIGGIQTRETKAGVPFLTYSLAVNRYLPNSADQVRGTVADWYNVLVFDEKQVSFFQQHLRQGAQIFAEVDVRQKTVSDDLGENKLILTTLRQTSFDVVRFPKRSEEAEPSV